MQTEMFKLPPLVLTIRGIPVPPSKGRKERKTTRKITLLPNCHIPSKKNSKMVLSEVKGRKLKYPMLIMKPEIQKWIAMAEAHLESQLLSTCLTEGDAIQSALSKLSVILSQLPEDDSVNDMPVGTWQVRLCEPGNEGAVVVIERL